MHCTLTDTCPRPFDLRVGIVFVCNVGDASEAKMKSHGLGALAPLAISPASPPSSGTGSIGGLGRVTKAMATANLEIELPEFNPKNLREWGEDFTEGLLLHVQQYIAVNTKCTVMKKSCKKKFLQRQVKTAMRQSSSWGEVLKRPEQMYPVYEMGLSFRTEIEEFPSLPEFPSAARVSEFVA